MNSLKRFLSVAFLLWIVQPLHAQVPRYNSFLAAPAVIFLDFDGQYVSGTSWNWNGDINAQPSGLSSEDIRDIFNRVSEDYRPFNINVTTDSTLYHAAPFDQRIRVIVTVTSYWYGQVGGISYVGSFIWGDDTPGFVFSNVLEYNVKYIAEAASHEAGHTLGLQHQCTYDQGCNKTEEYAGGIGSGEIGWAPIMGMGYYHNFTTWQTGPNTFGCDQIQDDLAIIAGDENGIGYRKDDHGSILDSATLINVQSPFSIATGVIERQNDIDIFRFNLDGATTLRINAVPQNVGSNNTGANLDLRVVLVNSIGEVNGIYNPENKLEATLDTILNAGTYYLSVQATGNEFHSEYGSMGLYYLYSFANTILPLESFILKADTKNDQDFLQWKYTSDERVSKIVVEMSEDGVQFKTITSLAGDAKNYSRNNYVETAYYRLKAVMSSEARFYYSNIIRVQRIPAVKLFRLQSNIARSSISITSQAELKYKMIDVSGRVLQEGRLNKGANHLSTSNIANGIFYLRISNTVMGWTEKVIKQ